MNRALLLCAALLAFAGGFARSARAALDVQPADGIPDVWALLHGAGALAPGDDADGDGLSNGAEAAAGTDPFRPSSAIRISRMSYDDAGMHLSFPTLRGKRYQIESSPEVASPTWTNVGALLAGNDADVNATVPGNGANRFYRVVVQDTDSDGDGVTDWEEIVLRFDPENTHSGGLGAGDDLAVITAALRGSNAITIEAATAVVAEPAANSGSVTPATFTVRRSGGLAAVTVNYSVAGSATAGADFTALSGTVTLGFGVNSATITTTPRADTLVESTESIIVSLAPGAGYTIGAGAVATVLIRDDVKANGDGVLAQYFNNTSATVPNFAVAPALTRIEPQINGNWPAATNGGSPGTGVNGDYFATRWRAEVLPEFSQIYTFYVTVNTGGRLWVNGQLLVNNWGSGAYSGEFSGTIALEGGRRYALVLEHFERTGDASATLSWQSANQPRQVIPQTRLFANAPPQILSATEALLLKGSGPYSYQIVASGDLTSYRAENLPPGWSFDPATGVISGSPAQEGTWQIALTATNSFGSGSAVLEVEIIATGGSITREVWSGVAGKSVAQIPLTTPPTSSAPITALEAPQDSGDNFGARIRGYITAPSSGVYRFWITADEAAELWISNDAEPVNAFKRAEVTAATSFRGWSDAGAGKTPLLWLDAGQRYYVEVRHKEATGADHVSVGWLKPGEGGSDPASAVAPSEIVPGYALSPYVAAAASDGQSTLFTTVLTTQGGATTSGYGSASVRLSADESEATLVFTFANLSSPVTGAHLHDGTLPTTSNIVFDIDDAEPAADGSFEWKFEPVAGLSSAQLVQHLKDGQIYLNIHTSNYPGGEIKGFFRLQAASQTFTAPAAAPAWSDDHTDANAASRFLIQSTFGPSASDIAAVQALGYEGWINAELAKPIGYHFPYVFTNRSQTDPNGPDYPSSLTFNSWWRSAVTAPDQLRQRVAFALSEILVLSEAGVLSDRADTLSDYYDTLLDYSFGNAAITPGPSVPRADGNFLNLLKAVTLHPAMGRYLDMLRNDKPSLATGRIPNENYAREILQLFSIGLNRLWPDGSLMLNSKGDLIPTYDQNVVMGFAHAFTGWDYNYSGAYKTSFNAASDRIDPMREVPVRHFTGQKRILNNVVLPGLATVAGQPLDPYASHTAAQYNDAAYQALAAQEIDATHNAIFNHPNVSPFICRQLIQRLVTSTPSRGYLFRVVSKFNDNGAGVRGDLRAVIKAILLDYEARSPLLLAQQGFGKQREPVLRVTAIARAFPAPAPVTGTYAQGSGSDPLNLIRVTTSGAHLYANGNSAFLDFSGGSSGDPDDAAYGVNDVTATSFTVRPITSEGVTYSQAGGLITVRNTGGHTYATGNSVYIDFTSGAPSSPDDGAYILVSKTADNLEFTVRPRSAQSTTFSQSGNVLTFTTATAHSFAAGQSLFVDFGTSTPDAPADGVFTVASVSPDALQFTVTANDATTRTGSAFAMLSGEAATRSGNATTTQTAYAISRSGNVAVNYSDWSMNTTNTDLNQTPLQSPTVFNFFLPDYQYPGTLAEAGLITPEFELTSDTSVIRQANFIYNGLFTDALGQSGLESFKSGGRDIFVDLRPWTAAGPGGLPWVHNNNLPALIDTLNTRLLGGQLSASARTIIQTYVQTLGYSATPTATQLRDRIRAVVHLIVTSPDFTIQK